MDKADIAIERIRNAANIARGMGNTLVVAYSGGKDSDVLLLSGYASEMYDDALLPRGWTHVECATTAERGAKRTECLWMNPAAVEVQGSLFLEG